MQLGMAAGVSVRYVLALDSSRKWMLRAHGKFGLQGVEAEAGLSRKLRGSSFAAYAVSVGLGVRPGPRCMDIFSGRAAAHMISPPGRQLWLRPGTSGCVPVCTVLGVEGVAPGPHIPHVPRWPPGLAAGLPQDCRGGLGSSCPPCTEHCIRGALLQYKREMFRTQQAVLQYVRYYNITLLRFIFIITLFGGWQAAG